jgi:hypothetical protein
MAEITVKMSDTVPKRLLNWSTILPKYVKSGRKHVQIERNIPVYLLRKCEEVVVVEEEVLATMEEALLAAAAVEVVLVGLTLHR